MEFDVAVVGAGVIGGMLARELSKYDLSVCLMEKENDVACGSSKANSGIVHGGYDPEPGTLKAKLNAIGVEKLFAAAEELQVPIVRNGSMVCAFSEVEAEGLKTLYARGQENGIPGLAILSGEQARELEPQLSSEVQAVLYVPNAGIVCPYELTIAAVGNAMDNGVRLLRNFCLTSIDRTAEGFCLHAADGRIVNSRFAVNCAGGYADRVAAMVETPSFEIIPRAGEYLLLDKNQGLSFKHTLFQMPSKEGKGILVSPTVDGNLLTGPTAVRVDAPDATETTREGLEAVQRLASKTGPKIDFRQVITSFTGVRASTKTGDFIIEPASVPNFLHVAAIDSPGLSCCASIAEYAVELLKQMGLSLAKKNNWNGRRNDPFRFRKMSVAEKNAFIQEHPDYGKIVCRCEMVSEGEIRAAIRENPKAVDLDGVKRRTRAGMGRCQSGFCMPTVLELLAEEQGQEIWEITKNGGASKPVLGKL